MSRDQTPSETGPAATSPGDAEPASEAARPPYEPPRLTRKKPVHRATLFTGGGGPSSAPLVPSG